jgi:membrane-associated phospholipid phosphatase
VVVSTSVDPQRAAAIALTGVAVLVASMLAVGFLGELVLFGSSAGRFDLEWTDWIARHRVPVLDTLATVGSSFTDTWTVIGTAFGASVVLWATGNRWCACTLPIGLTVELAVFLIVSTIIGRERPDVTPLGSVPSTSSFPSGHVAAGVVLYGGLVVIAVSLGRSRAGARRAATAAAVLIVWVAVARVYEGVHHPTDVLGGALLGVGALIVAASSTGVTVRIDRVPDARRVPTRRPLGVTRS